MMLRNRYVRAAVRLAREARSTSEAVDQLEELLRRECEEHARDVAELKKQLAILAWELAEARLEIARRDRERAFEAWQPGSATRH